LNETIKNIRPIEEIKEVIPFYDENKEITDFNTRVHDSEPAALFAIGATVLITFPAASNPLLTADDNVFVTKDFALYE
jgi:hypothetical protein